MADDIQFLGNWNSQQTTSNSSFVSAIVLTPVTISSTSPLEAPRTYSRTTTSVVHIGRVGAMPHIEAGEDKAGFVNPVMSRSHAKITFADSGSAFVIDTNSHHGTSISRASGHSLKLAPESPVQLQDGDEVTFGKHVLKNGTCHEPLTVAVKLLRSTTPSPNAQANTSSSPKSRNRFGLDSSSESDSESGNEDKGLRTGPNAITVNPLTNFFRARPKDSENNVDVNHSSSSSPQSSKLSPLAYEEISPPPYLRGSPVYSLPPDIRSPPPGLDLTGMGNTSADIVDESPSLFSRTLAPITTAAPPWRRANMFNISSFISPTHPEEASPETSHPRKIGRLLNPLWMRSLRTSGVEGRRTGWLGMDGEDPGRLDSGWGLYGRRGTDLRDELKSMKESIEGLKKEIEGLKVQDVDNESSTDHNHALTSKTNDALTELAAVKGTLSNLKEDIRDIESDLEGLKDSDERQQDDRQDDIEMMQGEIEVLKADTALLHNEVADTRSTHKAAFDKVAGEVSLLSSDTRAFRAEYAGSRDNIGDLQGGWGTLRGDLKALQGELGRVDATVQKFAEDIQNLKGHRCMSEQELQNEIQLTLAKAPQSSSAGTKRKRGDDDVSGNDTVTSSPARRPYKRLRRVANFAAAGAVGAVSAWLGLAYL